LYGNKNAADDEEQQKNAGTEAVQCLWVDDIFVVAVREIILFLLFLYLKLVDLVLNT
jgi:hypothetical protein